MLDILFIPVKVKSQTLHEHLTNHSWIFPSSSSFLELTWQCQLLHNPVQATLRFSILLITTDHFARREVVGRSSQRVSTPILSRLGRPPPTHTIPTFFLLYHVTDLWNENEYPLEWVCWNCKMLSRATYNFVSRVRIHFNCFIVSYFTIARLYLWNRQ